jgi:hypothetical protein
LLIVSGYEIWSLTGREDHRFRGVGNKVMIKLSGLKEQKITGQRKLHDKKQRRDLLSSINIIRVILLKQMPCSGHVT